MVKHCPDIMVKQTVKRREPVEIDDFLLAGRAGDSKGGVWNFLKAAAGATFLVGATWAFLYLYFLVTAPNLQ